MAMVFLQHPSRRSIGQSRNRALIQVKQKQARARKA